MTLEEHNNVLFTMQEKYLEVKDGFCTLGTYSKHGNLHVIRMGGDWPSVHTLLHEIMHWLSCYKTPCIDGGMSEYIVNGLNPVYEQTVKEVLQSTTYEICSDNFYY